MPRAEREAQILGIAERTFGEKGYQATTVDDVACAAGITKPVVYDLFGSKDGLLGAVIVRARTQLQDAMIAAWAELDGTEPTYAYFRSGVEVFFRFMDEHASAWQLLNQESAFGVSASAHLEDFRNLHVRNLIDVLTTAGRAPDVPETVLEGVMEGLVGALERVAVWRTTRDGVTAEEATDLVLALTWHGLATAVGEGGEKRPDEP